MIIIQPVNHAQPIVEERGIFLEYAVEMNNLIHLEMKGSIG